MDTEKKRAGVFSKADLKEKEMFFKEGMLMHQGAGLAASWETPNQILSNSSIECCAAVSRDQRDGCHSSSGARCRYSDKGWIEGKQNKQRRDFSNF